MTDYEAITQEPLTDEGLAAMKALKSGRVPRDRALIRIALDQCIAEVERLRAEIERLTGDPEETDVSEQDIADVMSAAMEKLPAEQGGDALAQRGKVEPAFPQAEAAHNLSKSGGRTTAVSSGRATEGTLTAGHSTMLTLMIFVDNLIHGCFVLLLILVDARWLLLSCALSCTGLYLLWWIGSGMRS